MNAIPSPPALASPPGVRRALASIVAIVLFTRLIVVIAAWSGAFIHFRLDQGVQPPMQHRERELIPQLLDTSSPQRRDFDRRVGGVAPLMNWDAGYYGSIIHEGYKFERIATTRPIESAGFNIAFFPFFPLVASLLTPMLSPGAALAVTSNASAVLAACVLYVWARRLFSHGAALYGVVLAFAWPTACFYSFGYAESLSFLLIATAMWLCELRGPFAGACAAALATATRPTSIVIAPLIAWRAAISPTASQFARIARVASVFVLSCSGLLTYLTYLRIRFGAWDVYAQNFRQGWIPAATGHDIQRLLLLAPIWETLKPLRRSISGALIGQPVALLGLTNPTTWNMPLTLLIIVWSLLAIRRVPPAVRPWLLIAPLVFVQRYLVAGWSGFGMESTLRYVSVAPAFFIVAGDWLRRVPPLGRSVTLAALIVVQVSWAFFFGMGEWVG